MTGLPIKQLLAVITPVVVLIGRLLLRLLLLMLLIRRVDGFAGSLALKVTLTPGDQVAHAGSPSPYEYRRGPVPDAAAPDQVFVTAELFDQRFGPVNRSFVFLLGVLVWLCLQIEFVQNVFKLFPMLRTNTAVRIDLFGGRDRVVVVIVRRRINRG